MCARPCSKIIMVSDPPTRTKGISRNENLFVEKNCSAVVKYKVSNSTTANSKYKNSEKKKRSRHLGMTSLSLSLLHSISSFSLLNYARFLTHKSINSPKKLKKMPVFMLK